jgi:hypothetical protein
MPKLRSPREAELEYAHGRKGTYYWEELFQSSILLPTGFLARLGS